MARTVRRSGIKEFALSEIKDDLSRFLHEAETQEIVITRHGKPAGVLIGSNLRMIGSIIGWKTIPASCDGSNKHETAGAPRRAMSLDDLKTDNDGCCKISNEAFADLTAY